MTAPLSAPNNRPGQGHKNRYFIQALVCPNQRLVYVRNLKCASTFFYTNFINHGWQEIHWVDIDWHGQLVFSHILEPYERRYKAQAEYIDMLGLNSLYESNDRFKELINESIALDQHSASYIDTFGPAVYSIDWIPLHTSHSENIRRTEVLLDTYGIKHPWTYDRVHVSQPEKKALEKSIKQYRSTVSEHVALYLDCDCDLYRVVEQNFNDQADVWQAMSWRSPRR